MYHRVRGPEALFPGLDVGVFRGQMQWLRDNCTLLDPDSLPLRGQRDRSRRPAILITFDDGYRDYRELAYPILRQLGIPALVFLATEFMDSPGKLLWSDRLYLAVRDTRRRDCALPWLPERTLSLADAGARAAFLEACKRHLKTLEERDKDPFVDALLAALDAPPADIPRQMLDWSEVRSCSDLTRWGGHTHTHRILSRLPPEESEAEIAACSERIAAETGRRPRAFAYPNGLRGDFDSTTQSQLLKHGYDVAFTAYAGCFDESADWMAVPRVSGQTGVAPTLAWRLATTPRRGRR
jgi:peptidoglycan/xylan/chitin deacetylase (PgdA/CDA1 family)